jgi:pimeloyl-ACP methyl ester carboxylesterase
VTSTIDPTTGDAGAIPPLASDPEGLLAGERRVRVGDLDIAYQSFGDPADPPVVLVMGLGTQMVGWPEDLIHALADAGHHVIRYDNRDMGGSTHLDHLPMPTVPDLRKILFGRKQPGYRLDDMADDCLGLIDALGLGKVHLVGVSMGGFISQTAVLKAPERFRSLTLIMTSTGSKRVGKPSLTTLRGFMTQRSATSVEETIDHALETYRAIGSPGFPFDEAYLRRKAEISFERGKGDNEGQARQLAASIAQPNRTPHLAKLDLPTMVMHGLNDPVVNASGGLALARTIKGAKFVGYTGMGHDLPRALWPDMAREMNALFARADTA